MENLEELHDSSIQSIRIDFEKQIISVEVSIYNNETKDYYSICLTFYEVQNYKTNDIFINVFEELGIYTFDYKEYNGKKEVEFVILTGSGKQDININFKCAYFKREVL